MKYHIAAVLLLAVASMTIAGWSEETQAQTNVKRVGILTYFEGPNATWDKWWAIITRRLAEEGWIEGKNVLFEYRSARADPLKLDRAAAELLDLDVDVIFAVSAPALRAAHSATRTIPIVGVDYTTDPVAEGYVENYGRPGGNVTGVFLDAPQFAGKWFEILKSMIPDLSRVAVLWDPAPGNTHVIAARKVAESLNVDVQVFEVHEPGDIDKAFGDMGKRPQAVIILPSPMIYNESSRLAKLALKRRTLAISFARAFADAGGAIAYGPADDAAIESMSFLLAKILGGANPATLPVERPAKVQLFVNLKTAKTLGITVPDSILLRADEVIE